MIDNFFANTYMHLPGQTIVNIDQENNLIKNKKGQKRGKGKKGQGKGKKGKGKGYNTNYLVTTTTTTTTTTTATTTNNNHNRKAKQKEKVPSGATTTTTPARARTSRVTRTTTKERVSLHRLPRLQDAAFVANSDTELPRVSSTTRRASITSNNNNYHLNISGFSFRAHQISPSHTCLQRASLPSTSSSYHNNNLSFSINRYDKLYPLLHQHRLWQERPHRELTSTTSVPSTTYQQHGWLWRRTTTRHRRTSSLLWHQPAESRTSSRSTSRVTSSLGHTLWHHCCYIACTSKLRRPRTFTATLHTTFLSTATNQPIYIYGYKDSLLICNNIRFPVRLYIGEVKVPLLGLHDVSDSGIILYINGKDSSTIEHQGEIEPLYHHRSHLFIDDDGIRIRRQPQDISALGSLHSTPCFDSDWDRWHRCTSTSWRRSRMTSITTFSHSTITSRTRNTLIEISTIPILVLRMPAGKRPRRPTSDTTSARRENVSITQLDHTFTHDPHQAPQRSSKPHTYTILTAIESTTDLCTAVLTSKKGYTPHQAAQLHRWIVKHGFTKSILQSDAETALMQLVNTDCYTVSTDLKLPTRVSSPYSHQSQGKVERFHRNLVDQLRTKLQWSKDLKTEPHMLPPQSLLWALQHSIFILNNYLVHSSDKTSHFENYRYNYRSNIVGFGEIVLGGRPQHPDSRATSQETTSKA